MKILLACLPLIITAIGNLIIAKMDRDIEKAQKELFKEVRKR